MGDKSPEKQIKIGNLTIKLNPNNQQKNRRDLNYERYHYHKNNDRNNYNERGRDNDRERNKYQNREREKNYKKNEFESRKDKYKNYKNKSNSNSSSENRHRHSHHQNNRSRSRSKPHSYHNNQNKNYINDNKNNQADNNKNNNMNNAINDSQNKNNEMNNNANANNNLQNNPNNMGFNQIGQNFFNNYINSDFFKKFYQMNNKLGNNNTNNIIVPIGIPINYFYNPNLNNINQMNKNNNINNQNNQNNQNINNPQGNNKQNQNQNQKQKEEPSNTILITDLDTNITKETLEDIFREKSLNLQISMPIDIRLVEALNSAYIIFPSVTSCVAVYNSLINQKILINGKYFPVQYSPNLTSKYSNNRDTLTYVTQISSNTSLTTSMETTVHEDWYCVYCDTKNFSRRTVCFKCQKPKSINCRVVPVIKQKKIILGANGEILPNNSIIIQGKQVQYSNEGEVFIFLLI